jgi:pimeloyl-ACP methyl ester carboxylesterase
MFVPADGAECTLLRDWLASLADGELCSVRGRDLLAAPGLQYGPWEYGMALKAGSRCFFLWAEKVESCLICGVNYLEQLHFEIRPTLATNNSECSVTSPSRLLLLALCHGFDAENGPHYAFLKALRVMAAKLGAWKLVVPDFRPSYIYGPARGRSERVRILQEELLLALLEHRDAAMGRAVVLVGHSQGGAACAQLCASARLVTALPVRGLVLLGSESPVERLQPTYAMVEPGEEPLATPGPIIHATRPQLPAEAIRILHARSDSVVSRLQLQSLAESWGVSSRCVILDSGVTPDDPESHWAADVQHDFIARDMLRDLFGELVSFLDGVHLADDPE